MPDDTVKLDPELHRRIAELVEVSGAFDSVEEYVNCVLAELFGESELREADEEKERMLRQRLKDLGYM